METFIKRIRRMDELISGKRTGAPADLARKLGISERSVFSYLKFMKELGAPITYSRLRESYSYKTEGQFTISFVSN